jgi:hypothetical protein
MAEDDIGEIRDELNEYKKQLDSLREDLRLLIRHSPQSQNDIMLCQINEAIPAMIKPKSRGAVSLWRNTVFGSVEVDPSRVLSLRQKRRT